MYATEGSAGFDVRAYLPNLIYIRPNDRAIIPLGFCMKIPKGYEAEMRPRSGLAAKHGITLLNSPGTIDSDYRDEVKAILINHSNTTFVVNHGDRIAQILIKEVEQVKFSYVKELDETTRKGGFGHTGIK